MLQPLPEIYLQSHRELEAGTNGNLSYLYLFSTFAALILLIACINFTNLATAHSARRAREVGMRKVVGARRLQLVLQLLGESILFSLLAIVLAIALCHLLLPAFNGLTGKTLRLDLFYQGPYVLMLLGFGLFVGILAGSYPAWILSGLRPVSMLKGTFRSTVQGATLRKALVVSQFAISIILLVGTSIVYTGCISSELEAAVNRL